MYKKNHLLTIGLFAALHRINNEGQNRRAWSKYRPPSGIVRNMKGINENVIDQIRDYIVQIENPVHT